MGFKVFEVQMKGALDTVLVAAINEYHLEVNKDKIEKFYKKSVLGAHKVKKFDNNAKIFKDEETGKMLSAIDIVGDSISDIVILGQQEYNEYPPLGKVYNVELIYIGTTSKFFIHGQHYIMEFWEAFNQCTDETGNKRLWTIDEIFKQFVTPVVWGKMRN